MDSASGAWSQEAKLTASTPIVEAHFGSSVAIDGDVAVVASPRANSESGLAYIFERQPDNSWTEVVILSAYEPTDGDRFGISVGVSGPAVIVGSYREDDGGVNRGAAYIYEKQPGTGVWTNATKLLASDTVAGRNFGTDTAIQGMRAVVGAPKGSGEAGQVYVFERLPTGWYESAVLQPSDGSTGDDFGVKVALDGNTVVVSAQGVDDGFGKTDVGAVYFFEKRPQGWLEVYKFENSCADSANKIGGSGLAIGGGTIAIGANLIDRVYVLDQAETSESAKQCYNFEGYTVESSTR